MDILDILLNNEPPKGEEREIKIKRLSEAWGAEVIFKIKAISYNKVSDIKKRDNDDMSIHILLSGIISPNLKNKELLEKYGVPTPAELVKKLFLPGEIEDISREIEKLSGYRTITIEEIKKK